MAKYQVTMKIFAFIALQLALTSSHPPGPPAVPPPLGYPPMNPSFGHYVLKVGGLPGGYYRGSNSALEPNRPFSYSSRFGYPAGGRSVGFRYGLSSLGGIYGGIYGNNWNNNGRFGFGAGRDYMGWRVGGSGAWNNNNGNDGRWHFGVSRGMRGGFGPGIYGYSPYSGYHGMSGYEGRMRGLAYRQGHGRYGQTLFAGNGGFVGMGYGRNFDNGFNGIYNYNGRIFNNGNGREFDFSNGRNLNNGNGINFNDINGRNLNNGNGINFNDINGRNFNNGNGINFNDINGRNFNNGNGINFNDINGRNFDIGNGMNFNNANGRNFDNGNGVNLNNINGRNFDNGNGINVNDLNGRNFNNGNGINFKDINGRNFNNGNGINFNDINGRNFANGRRGFDGNNNNGGLYGISGASSIGGGFVRAYGDNGYNNQNGNRYDNRNRGMNNGINNGANWDNANGRLDIAVVQGGVGGSSSRDGLVYDAAAGFGSGVGSVSRGSGLVDGFYTGARGLDSTAGGIQHRGFGRFDGGTGGSQYIGSGSLSGVSGSMGGVLYSGSGGLDRIAGGVQYSDSVRFDRGMGDGVQSSGMGTVSGGGAFGNALIYNDAGGKSLNNGLENSVLYSGSESGGPYDANVNRGGKRGIFEINFDRRVYSRNSEEDKFNIQSREVVSIGNIEKVAIGNPSVSASVSGAASKDVGLVVPINDVPYSTRNGASLGGNNGQSVTGITKNSLNGAAIIRKQGGNILDRGTGRYTSSDVGLSSGGTNDVKAGKSGGDKSVLVSADVDTVIMPSSITV